MTCSTLGWHGHPDVSIDRAEQRARSQTRMLQIVDRGAFALELARRWVTRGCRETQSADGFHRQSARALKTVPGDVRQLNVPPPVASFTSSLMQNNEFR